MEFLQSAVGLNRENPLGYSFLALARMFSYEMEYDLKERAKHQELMLQDIGEALARGLKRIEKNPRDSERNSLRCTSFSKRNRCRPFPSPRS